MRLAIDEQRRRRRWGFFALRNDDVDWATERDPDLWHALEELDPRVRAALVLTVLDGYTHQELADALEVPRGTVASWFLLSRLVRPLPFSQSARLTSSHLHSIP